MASRMQEARPEKSLPQTASLSTQCGLDIKKAGQLMGLPAIYDVLGMYGRDDVTRTRDPYVPNVVRYQLRYISIS